MTFLVGVGRTRTLLYTVVIAMQHVILAYHNKMRRHIASEPCTH